MVFALIGNQNCGKTTLFNRLTGSSQHVGNFPGVTVDKKEGILLDQFCDNGQKHTLIDLPGIYSLSPYSTEEIVTRDFLLNEKPDGIINVIDANNPDRNLYLTLQLLELEIPMVIVFNMIDEVEENGGRVDTLSFSQVTGIKAVAISASKNRGIKELCKSMIDVCLYKKVSKLSIYKDNISHAMEEITKIISLKSNKNEIPVRFAAAKLWEGDPPMQRRLGLTKNEIDKFERIIALTEKEIKNDREAAIADARYEYISSLCRKTIQKGKRRKGYEISEKIDKVLTNKYLALPCFIFIMSTIFWITFGRIGSGISALLSVGIDIVCEKVCYFLSMINVNDFVISLVRDCLFLGVGSVISFLPSILLLFFFLSLLEDSGYMARIAFISDSMLSSLGLTGRSIVPLLIGFGCSVPAVMSARTIVGEKERKMTILLVPFVSCSAKIPIYLAFGAAFFSQYKAFIMIFLYSFGLFIGLLSSVLFRKTIYKGESSPFIMELPPYRLPSFKNVMLHMWQKAKDFIQKAFTVIFLATILIWFLQNFNFAFKIVTDPSESILFSIGNLLSPIFSPLGFGGGIPTAALITGFTAKEAVISTFSMLLGDDGEGLSAIFSIRSALSFLIFTLLYTPCIAAISVIKREFKKVSAALFVIAFQFSVAWVAAFVIYNISGIFLSG